MNHKRNSSSLNFNHSVDEVPKKITARQVENENGAKAIVYNPFVKISGAEKSCLRYKKVTNKRPRILGVLVFTKLLKGLLMHFTGPLGCQDPYIGPESDLAFANIH